VADSDVEMETATSNPTGAANKSQHHIESISDDEKEITNITNEVAVSISATKGNVIHPKYPEKVEDLKPIEEDVKIIEKTAMYRSTAEMRMLEFSTRHQRMRIWTPAGMGLLMSYLVRIWLSEASLSQLLLHQQKLEV
jgi:hypothetical protein